eukprot:TRINITY_DN4661_c0_g3_i6.p1 TRINITY_DN4661_c0_g3~~TRINITY_DN4661_c0_g3_i6.p1  ORF type:complete len:398 (-),score=92.03 TRINITY_DN4661_c0_g3_i6:278-1471(-)
MEEDQESKVYTKIVSEPSREDFEVTCKVLEYLWNHPEENQNHTMIKKIRYFANEWIDPEWRTKRKKALAEERLEKDRLALDQAGIRSGRQKKKELQEAWNNLVHQNEIEVGRILFHPEDDSTSLPIFGLESMARDGELPNVPDITGKNEIPKNTETPENLEKINRKEELEKGEEIENKIVSENNSTEDRGIRIETHFPCYVCKKEVSLVHHFYDQMCLTCGDFNYQKRYQVADLTDKVALVTGGRIKIGYEVCLKLLRCGASVITTTRFPKDAVQRYSREQDFSKWKDKIHIYGLDLRLLGHVEEFVQHVLNSYSRLDILINNAAQTIRRPPIFYKHLLEGEKKNLCPQYRDMYLEFKKEGSNLLKFDASSLELEREERRIIPQMDHVLSSHLSPAG